MLECESFEMVPPGLSNLIASEELYFLKFQDVKHVPETFGRLTCLKMLDMSKCEALEVFPYGCPCS